MKPDELIIDIEARYGQRFTEEQREFIRDITTPMFCFASPGTGKTHSATAALAVAELCHRIPGDKIYALSFTNKATTELQVRHLLMCRKFGIKQRVVFQTLHKLCSRILSNNYKLLDMSSYDVKKYDIERIHSMVLKSAEEFNISLSQDKVTDFLNAVRTLNSTLVFDKEHVMNSEVFHQCGLDYEGFTKLRSMLYNFYKLIGKIDVSDILIYTLELLTNNPELTKRIKADCRIILVDEAQDLSLLQLQLINMISDCPVLIGDQKQQIYGFNGALSELKEEFFRIHPDARKLKLTQSFRCTDEIAAHSTPIILKNKVGGEDFKGCRSGGIVEILDGTDVKKIVSDIEKDMADNDGVIKKDILFLYRNNYAGIPVIEELFQRNIPFRSYKYPGVTNVKYIKELCDLINFARSPMTPGLDAALRYVIPEFRGTSGRTDLMLVAHELGCSPFEVNYHFKNEYIGSTVMQALLKIQELMRSGAKASELFNTLWPIYSNVYVSEQERYTDKPAKYYTDLVKDIAHNKTYDKFCQDENEKMKRLKQFEDLRIGIRCYTMHAAKGLEADVVHILDASRDTVPNTKFLDRMIKHKCLYDAAKTVRNERSLAYVACTRAKSELYVHYDKMCGLSPIFENSDEFSDLDDVYTESSAIYDDFEAFAKFTEL